MLTIRAETPADYAAIAAVNARAFGERASEAVIVTLLRQRANFDPTLSLVAELDGRVVGQVLFSPYTVRLLGEAVRAVNLAPIAIDPAHQRQGLGGQLIGAGHALAREQGFAFSFLLGHPGYYPRFGYRQRAYGAATLTVSVNDVLSYPALIPRRLAEADVPALHALWRETEGAVDFALDPGLELLDWISPNPAIESWVFAEANVIVGYARVPVAERHQPRVFFTREVDIARRMLAYLAQTASTPNLILPLHPASRLAALGQATANAWDAAMACPLWPSPFDEYYSQVLAKHRPPGQVIWPTAFDLS